MCVHEKMTLSCYVMRQKMHGTKREFMNVTANAMLKQFGVTDVWANDANIVTCGAGIALASVSMLSEPGLPVLCLCAHGVIVRVCRRHCQNSFSCLKSNLHDASCEHNRFSHKFVCINFAMHFRDMRTLH